jgi:uncharacterized surface anchored protein
MTIKPKTAGTAISKNGVVDSEANPQYIDWSIDVNTIKAGMQDAIVADTLPTGVSLVPGSLKIYQLNIGYNGAVLGNEVTSVSGGAIQLAPDERSFKVDFDGINSAYRIKYRTKIDTFGVVYSNVASIKDGEAGSPITVTKGLGPYTNTPIIEKKAGEPQNDSKGNTRTIKWTLDVNKQEKDIGNAILEDQVDSKQSIIENSIKIYKLSKSGSSWTRGSQVTLDPSKIEINTVSGGALKLTLGALDKEAYQIIYETQVLYDEVFVPELTLSNTATLKDGSDTIGSATNTAKAVRKPLLKKEKVSTTVDYDKKKIGWKLTVNGGEHPISNAVINDQLPDGLTLVKDSIVIKNAAGTTIYSKDVANTNISVPSGSVVGPTGFTIGLGNITNLMTITYDTTISPDKYSTNITFLNSAWITGDTGIGPGSGDGTVGNETEASDKPQIANTFSKDTVSNTVKIGNVTYGPVNYINKTMSWVLTIKPKKEGITKLFIKDTFPSDGLYFLESSLCFLKDTTELNWTKGNDYTINPVTIDTITGYQNGFELTINQPILGSDYKIYYQTSFDKDVYPNIKPNTSTAQYYYDNKAEFVYSKDGTPPGISGGSDDAQYVLNKTSYDNGRKEGVADLQGRIIAWSIYANDQARTIDDDLVITDRLTLGKHELSSEIQTKLTVKKYTVNASDNTSSIERTLASNEYTLDVDPDNKGFTLKILDVTNGRYLIQYNSEIQGISDEIYKNEATILGKTYSAQVKNNNYQKFLDKTATNVGQSNQVSLDDEIDWKVTLNKSLSEVKTAKFTDVISGGHQYVLGSLKVYQIDVNITPNSRTEVKPSPSTYQLTEYKNSSTGQWTLTVEFANPITRQYELEYTTIVTSKTGSINNSASFTGTGVSGTSSGNKTYTITQNSSGTGTGTSSKGTLVIEKKDAATGALINSEATFGLYYDLNGEQILFGGETKKTVNGKLTYTGVPVRKTYQLKEITEPAGYTASSENIAITGLIAKGTVTKTVMNEKQKKQLKITKIDAINNGKKLGGAEFELYKIISGSQSPVGTYTTSPITGEVTIDGLDNGEYTLVETKAPDGYQLPEDPVTNVTINLETVTGDGTADNTLSLTVGNAPLKSVIVKKVDDEDSSIGLGGAEFELRKAFFSNELVKTLVSDTNGYISMTDLGVGRYRLIETKAPDGYELPEHPITEFTVTYAMVQNDISLDLGNIANERVRTIQFKKVDKEDHTLGLEGAVFDLLRDGKVIRSDITSAAEGMIEIKNLTKGNYTLVEKTPPVGYQMPDNPNILFNITRDMPAVITGATIENEKLRSLTIKKIDSTDATKYLANAEFKVKSPDGSERTVKTGEDGTVTLEDLIYGEYVITEVNAPQGYNLNNTPVNVTVNDTALTFTVEIKNVKYVYVPAPPVYPGYSGNPTPAPSPTATPKPSITPQPTVAPLPTATPKPSSTVTPKAQPTAKPTPAPSPTPEPIITEITSENTPKGGTIPVLKGETATKGKDPDHGKVTVDNKGKWNYKPDPGFTGDDDFSVIVTGPTGEQEEIFIDIAVEDVPLSGDDKDKESNIPKTDIPKTGEDQYRGYYLQAGILVCLISIIVKSSSRKNKTK